MSKLASLLSASLLATTIAAAGCTVSTSTSDSTLTVENHSDYDITELYFTFSTSSDFGSDRLHGVPLLPGDTITLTGITCDTYDVKFYDETGASCEADNIDICFSDSAFIITNNTCNVFTREDPSKKGLHTPHAVPATTLSQQ